MRVLGIAVGLALTLAAPANALSLPSGGTLKFDVVRKGKDIGDHSYQFSGSKDAFSVNITTDIAVKIPLIRTTVYSFEHKSTEHRALEGREIPGNQLDHE